MNSATASPWDQEVSSGGGLYLKIEPNTSARIRIVGRPLAFQDEFQGKKYDRWGVTVIEKTLDANNKPQRAVKAFRFGVSIFKAIQSLWRNDDWGNPEDYDLTITRKGSGLDTEYTVVPSPKKPLTDEEKTLVEEANLDLVKLFLQNGNGQASAGTAKAATDEYDPFADA